MVVGRANSTEIYEALGEAGQVPERILAAARRYESAWEHYQSGDFNQALADLAGFEAEFGEDMAALRLRQICEEFLVNPPEQWDGIAKMHQK